MIKAGKEPYFYQNVFDRAKSVLPDYLLLLNASIFERFGPEFCKLTFRIVIVILIEDRDV